MPKPLALSAPRDAERHAEAMIPDDSTAARVASASVEIPLLEAVHSTSPESLTAAASDLGLTEDLALVLLKRADLPAQALEKLSKNGSVMKSRKVKLALVEHPKTPRHISVPTVRHLFTFDLMQVALTPVVPADIKMAAEESLINRLEKISQGERLSLAHRASGRVAAALLLDPATRDSRRPGKFPVDRICNHQDSDASGCARRLRRCRLPSPQVVAAPRSSHCPATK